MRYEGPDDELYWREEAFGEHPILNPWGDPHHPPETKETEECSTSS
jgi:hypothetical protein